MRRDTSLRLVADAAVGQPRGDRVRGHDDARRRGPPRSGCRSRGRCRAWSGKRSSRGPRPHEPRQLPADGRPAGRRRAGRRGRGVIGVTHGADVEQGPARGAVREARVRAGRPIRRCRGPSTGAASRRDEGRGDPPPASASPAARAAPTSTPGVHEETAAGRDAGRLGRGAAREAAHHARAGERAEARRRRPGSTEPADDAASAVPESRSRAKACRPRQLDRERPRR